MGSLCATNSTELPSEKALTLEEIKILKNERSFSWGKLNTESILQALKSQGQGKSLTQRQLESLCDELGTSKSDLFESLKNSEGSYDIKKLAVLAILTGKGNPSSKANWMFEHFASQEDLTENELTTLLEDVHDISANLTPRLSLGSDEDHLTSEEIDLYTEPLKTKKEAFVRKGCESILTNGRVSQSEFCAILGDNQHSFGRIYVTNGVRKTVRLIKDD